MDGTRAVTKVCSNPKCEMAGTPQPIANFYPYTGASARYGYRPLCKPCDLERRRMWARAYREQAAKRNRENPEPATKVCANRECSHAGLAQPIANFYRESGSKDGRNRRCIACVRRWWKENHDRVHECQRKYVENNKERILVMAQARRKANREEYNAKKREYYRAQDPLVLRERHAKYYDKYRARIRSYGRERYHGNAEYREAALERLRKGAPCPSCGKRKRINSTFCRDCWDAALVVVGKDFKQASEFLYQGEVDGKQIKEEYQWLSKSRKLQRKLAQHLAESTRLLRY
jgi:hypothetical protein